MDNLTPSLAPELQWKLWIYTNYDCNLRCSYCVAESSPSAPRRAIGLANVRHLVNEAVALGFTDIFFTGGEPFILNEIYALDGPCDIVLGPCDDGGYDLIGLKQPQPRLLREVPMSTPTVARDTLALAAELGLRAALLPTWYDIDTAAELLRLERELLTLPPEICPATRRMLAELPRHP